MPKTYRVRTLGCKANFSDSQVIEAELQRRGYRAADESEAPDLVIVNSCTVTNEADKQSRKTAEHAARDYPDSAVVLTGCGAEVDPKRYATVPGLRFVMPNRKKSEHLGVILNALENEKSETLRSSLASAIVLGDVVGYEAFTSRHPMDREWPVPEAIADAPIRLDSGREGVHSLDTSARTRAFLKVQEGCNAFCTYCVIPYGRGPSRSLAPSVLIERVRELVSQGVREVVLTATNLGEYGVDLGTDSSVTLEVLVEEILGRTSLERLRLSSLDAREISTRLIRVMENEPRLCAHVHFSLQNIDSHILKRMKRKYTAPDAENKLLELAEASVSSLGGVYVGMDYITGFPGETEASFELQLEKLRNLPWNRLHVFPYSERGGTPAVKLDGSVPVAVRRERSRILNALSLERGVERARALLGQTLSPVLLESSLRGPDGHDGWWSGYTSNYHRVWIRPGDRALERQEIVSPTAFELMTDRRNGDTILLARL